MSTTFLSGLKLVKVFLRQRFAHFYTWYTDGHRERYIMISIWNVQGLRLHMIKGVRFL